MACISWIIWTSYYIWPSWIEETIWINRCTPVTSVSRDRRRVDVYIVVNRIEDKSSFQISCSGVGLNVVVDIVSDCEWDITRFGHITVTFCFTFWSGLWVVRNYRVVDQSCVSFNWTSAFDAYVCSVKSLDSVVINGSLSRLRNLGEVKKSLDGRLNFWRGIGNIWLRFQR